jgi:putative cell wall-binding protein
MSRPGVDCPTPRRRHRPTALLVTLALAISLLGGGEAVRAGEPDAQAAAERLATEHGGRAADYRLVHQRLAHVPRSDETLWVGKFLDRAGNVLTVYRDAQGRQGGAELLQARERASVQALSAFERKADAPLRAAVASAGKGATQTVETLPVAVWLAADGAAADRAVAARHPELSWVGGRPLADDLAAVRRIRGERWQALRDAYASVQEPAEARVRALGGSVAYTSTSAPLIFVDLPPGRVAALAEERGVESLGLEQTWRPSMSVAGPTVQANWTSGSGDQGSGVRVGVVEYHNVRGSGDLAGKVVAAHSTSGSLAYTGSGQFDHPTWVAGAIAGQSPTYRGVAPGAVIVSSGTGGYSPSLTYDRAVIAAADWAAAPTGGNADIVNTSLVQDTATGAEEARRYFDALVANGGNLAVSAAGNYVNFNSWTVGSPGTAWNVLTVGGTDDRNTGSWTDDRIWYSPGSNGSAYVDPSGSAWNVHGDFNKPNLSAPAVSVRTANGLAASGTSVATPIVAGIGAQLIARAPLLAAWPEAARAILMAGAIHHARMGDGSINADHEGAGLASALWSNRILVAGDGQYGGYQIGATTASEVVEQKIAVQAGQKVRVVVSWNSQVNGTSDSLLTDFDLQVVQPNGATSGSYSLDNNYEVVEFTAAGSGTATIRLPHNRFDTGSQRFGLAWTKWNLGTPTRVAGSDRYATAAAVSAASFVPGVPAAFVATGATFPDALAAGPAAALSGGPVLLTLPGSIPAATADELRRLRPGRIYVLGSSGAISEGVAQQLAAYASGGVTRLGGSDRYATAAAVSRAFFSPGVAATFVATGANYPDALSGGPAAAANRSPLLLTRLDGVPAPTAAEIQRLRPARIFILGGSGVVSDAVANQLRNLSGAQIVRLAGGDRYATSAAISRQFFSAPPAAYLATGANFPDALAAVPAAGISGSPLLLVQPSGLPGEIATELRRIWPPRTLILGSVGAVSDAVVSQVRSLLGNP